MRGRKRVTSSATSSAYLHPHSLLDPPSLIEPFSIPLLSYSTRHWASYAWLVPVGNLRVILFFRKNRFSGDWKGGNEISRGNLKRVCAGKRVEMKGGGGGGLVTKKRRKSRRGRGLRWGDGYTRVRGEEEGRGGGKKEKGRKRGMSCFIMSWWRKFISHLLSLIYPPPRLTWYNFFRGKIKRNEVYNIKIDVIV